MIDQPHFKIHHAGPALDPMENLDLARELWLTLLHEVKALHLLAPAHHQLVTNHPLGPQRVFQHYLNSLDCGNMVVLDANHCYTKFRFPVRDGFGQVSAELACHWFGLARDSASAKIRKLLKKAKLSLVEPSGAETDEASESPLFVNLDGTYHRIEAGPKGPKVLGDGGEIALSSLPDWQRQEIQRLQDAGHCACHLCLARADEKNKAPPTTSVEEQPDYFRKEMAFLGRMQDCRITTRQAGGKECLTFQTPETLLETAISLEEYKKGWAKEHKFMFCNLAAGIQARKAIETAAARHPAVNDDGLAKIRRIIGAAPMADELCSLKLIGRYRAADVDLWYFEGSMVKDAVLTRCGILGKENGRAALPEKDLIFQVAAGQAMVGFRYLIHVRHPGYATFETYLENNRSQVDFDFCLENRLGYLFGPVADHRNGILRCLDDPAFAKLRGLGQPLT